MPKFETKSLENFLSYLTVKNHTIANNLANMGTVNYKREDVKFKDVLDSEFGKGAIRTTNSRHLDFDGTAAGDKQSWEIVQDDQTDYFSGKNNVDIDREMADLAQNTIKYKFATKKVGKYYKNLQEVIKNGGAH